jgi:hypothetical protein
MHLVRNLDERLWRDFVDSHAHGSIFHTPEMFEVFAHAKGHQTGVWA